MSVSGIAVVLSPAVTDRGADLLAIAAAASEHGFDGVWLPEHTHIPVHHPRTGPPELVPPAYRRLLDPYVALAAVASRFPQLSIGTCLTLAAQHEPVSLARALATLDRLSGGRLTIGVGFGWLLEEFEAYGHNASDRAAITEEVIEIITALWTQEQVTHSGAHLRIDATWSGPAPLQLPRPPILLGAGAHRSTYRRIARWADGWIAPLPACRAPILLEAVTQLRSEWQLAGRPGEPTIAALARLDKPAAIAEAIDLAQAAGCSALVLVTLVQDQPDLLRLLDAAAVTLQAS